MIEIQDQTGKRIQLKGFAKRIVSLVPSITELLFDLGLEDEVVGITKFCIHPGHWFRKKARIGGTKTVSIEKVAQILPDLVIANKEENVKEQVEALAARFPVYLSDVGTLPAALQMMKDIAQLTGKSESGAGLIGKIQEGFNSIEIIHKPVKTCYLIWQNPFITVGGDTFIGDMLNRAGFGNVFQNERRYPEINLQQLLDLNCELLLLSSEPFPFKEKHRVEIEARLREMTGTGTSCPVRTELVDGEIFSWYGSRMLQAPPYFIQLQNRLLS